MSGAGREGNVERRGFLRFAGGAGAFSFLSRLAPLSAADVQVTPEVVRFDPEIEPLVRLLEESPREKIIEEVAARVRKGTTYREVLAALLLAGIRNIQPRPSVGFKFHAVLVVYSAHQAAQNAPDPERWLPLFWSLDQFKSSQAADVREGDWTMRAIDEAKVPAPHKAREAFARAMDAWDETGVETAAAGLARGCGAGEVFELFARYAARDVRSIGHKAIYTANGWRTLQTIGWRHAEPVLRSIAYALVAREGSDPLAAENPVDRPWRINRELAGKIRADWRDGKPDAAAAADLLAALREASDEEVSKKVVEILNRGVAPQSIWDAVFCSASELLMRKPAIISLHAVTTTNAIRTCYDLAGDDLTRRLLLLQNAAFIPFYRNRGTDPKGQKVDALEAAEADATAEEVLADVSRDRKSAARKALAYLRKSPAHELVVAANRLIFLKGRDAHDYKFSSAVLEDYARVSADWRDRYLAANCFYLRGSGDRENGLMERTRAALRG